MKHTLPKTPEDVTSEHEDFIAVEILGLETITVNNELYWCLKDGELPIFKCEDTAFYTNIQHSKMLMEIVIKYNLKFNLSFDNEENVYICMVWSNKDDDVFCIVISESEPFARTSAICKAWMELNKK